MNSRRSNLIAFAIGAIVAALPFLLSSRQTLAKSPAQPVAEGGGTSMVIDGDYVYVAKPGKAYKILKSTMSVFQSCDLN